MGSHSFDIGSAQTRRRRHFRIGALVTSIALIGSVLLGALPTQTADAAVPVPGPGQAVISVKVGGDRTSTGTTRGLAGVTLSLYAAGTATVGPGTPIQGIPGTRYNPSWSWTHCTSDADGDCNFIIPIRAGVISNTGVPQDTRFWVQQAATDPAPTGWYMNPQMRTGGFGATPDYAWNYRFRTDTLLRAGVTYRSSAALATDADSITNPDRGFMRNREANNGEGGYAENVSRTTGVWSQSRVNPTFPTRCGLRIALIADTSGSLGAEGIAAEKLAMGQFIDAFSGTPATFSLFSFSTVSPGNGATNHPAPLPVATDAQAAVVKAQYANWNSGGGTNWQQGFAKAADSGNTYDLAVLLTDGNPTVMGTTPNSGASAYNALQDVDAGIFAANQLKAAGTRVLAVGVGPAVTAASELNLRAVSGTVSDSDYYNAANFAEAGATLAALATKNCQASIAVTKMIIPFGGTKANAVAATSPWTFNALAQDDSVTLATPAAATTSAGRVVYGLQYTAGATGGRVAIRETQQSGYTHVPISGQNAECTNPDTGGAVAVTNLNSADTPGFTVNSVIDVQVQCVIYNTPLPTPGALAIVKSSNPVSGTVITPGTSVTYTLTLSNSGQAAATVNHTDYLRDVLDDADWGTGPTVTGTGVTATRNAAPTNTIVLTGSVAGGATVTVSYTVKSKVGTTGNGTLRNLVGPTTVTPPTECVPGADPTWQCTVHPMTGSFALVKSSTPATGSLVQPGDVITYTVTATGANGPVKNIVITDNLTGVLGNATFVPGSATLTVAGGTPTAVANPTGTAPITLVSTPFALAPAQTATLTYRVTVNANAWSKTLVNVVTGVSEGNVPPTSCAPCTTTHSTPAILQILKTGESGSGTWVPMAGSSWGLLSDNNGLAGAPYTAQTVQAAVPASTGLFQVTGIPAGSYWLMETQAPTGFALLAEPVRFTISATGAVTLGTGTASTISVGTNAGTGVVQITVRDVPAMEMPEAGGTGTLPYTLGGAALLGLAAVLLIGLRRRRLIG